MKYLSQQLSKKIHDIVKGESDMWWAGDEEDKMFLTNDPTHITGMPDPEQIEMEYIIPAYTYFDIITKYAVELFGDTQYGTADIPQSHLSKPLFRIHTNHILFLLQEKASQEIIEAYIWNNCLFNKE